MPKLHEKQLLSQFELLMIKSENEGVKTLELNLSTDLEYAKYVDGNIGINTNVLDSIKHELLAEEIGHHRTTYGDITDQSNMRNLKLEKLARREGYKILLKPDNFLEPLRNGARSIYEFSDHLDISEKTLLNIINDWKKIYGEGIYIGDYYLNLAQI